MEEGVGGRGGCADGFEETFKGLFLAKVNGYPSHLYLHLHEN